ncbi:MAG: hypothetical protein RLZZ214_402 [Verrucomicrobiota bacterium]
MLDVQCSTFKEWLRASRPRPLPERPAPCPTPVGRDRRGAPTSPSSAGGFSPSSLQCSMLGVRCSMFIPSPSNHPTAAIALLQDLGNENMLGKLLKEAGFPERVLGIKGWRIHDGISVPGTVTDSISECRMRHQLLHQIAIQTRLSQRWLMGWFGIRGIGSLYCLSDALTPSVVALSVAVHGLTSSSTSTKKPPSATWPAKPHASPVAELPQRPSPSASPGSARSTRCQPSRTAPRACSHPRRDPPRATSHWVASSGSASSNERPWRWP